MSSFIKVIVYYLPQIHQRPLLQLNFQVHIYLDPRSMYYTQVSDKVLVIFLNDHELALPKLFIISDLVVIVISLTNLELSQVPFHSNYSILKFICIHIYKFQLKSL